VRDLCSGMKVAWAGAGDGYGRVALTAKMCDPRGYFPKKSFLHVAAIVTFDFSSGSDNPGEWADSCYDRLWREAMEPLLDALSSLDEMHRFRLTVKVPSAKMQISLRISDHKALDYIWCWRLWRNIIDAMPMMMRVPVIYHMVTIMEEGHNRGS
jgi:hypothetical protein